MKYKCSFFAVLSEESPVNEVALFEEFEPSGK
jgi:hypothetical protein